MCGIAGVIDTTRSTTADVLAATVTAMADSLRHRGPDGSGLWVDAEDGVALGHRRLAVLDLSDLAAQPMVSPCGRWVLTYNGELYNYADLSRQLEAKGHQFKGHGDTEVLAAALTEWGVRGAVERANAMFAFAAWDRHDRRLYLARDRAGEKPLYYTSCGDRFLFASELHGLRAHPDFQPRIDPDALAQYFRHKYVPAPASIYEGVYKLPAASILSTNLEGTGRPEVSPYWSVADAMVRGATDPLTLGDDALVDTVDAALNEAVRLRMAADVPLGAFLSGGIDSSTVVAMMQRNSGYRVRTFTMGSPSADFDESTEAAAVARQLGTRHTSVQVTPGQAMAVVDRLPHVYDEPFGDSSQIPTLLVSEIARRDVTVSLSGDAGDELFAGYHRHQWIPRIWSRARKVPVPVRRAVAGGLRRVPAGQWKGLSRVVGDSPRLAANKATKLAELLPLATAPAMYDSVTAHWPDADALVLGDTDSHGTPDPWPALSLQSQLTFADFRGYLPDDILVKVDRASMSVGLEARVPFLDHHLVELAARIPDDRKVRDGQGKWVLRQVLDRYVPRALVERPKAGFGVPVGEWLRGPLRPWAEELLAPDRLAGEGWLDPALVARRWEEHQDGRRDRTYQLWDVLMFEAWLEAHHG